MSVYDDLRELTRLDSREVFEERLGNAELKSELTREGELVCILCESGYHDHVWDVSHVQQCGCPCHADVAKGKTAGV